MNVELLEEKDEALTVNKHKKKTQWSSKVHFKLNDLSLPIKGRELVYKAFHENNVNVQEQQWIRLKQVNGNEQAVKIEVSRMAWVVMSVVVVVVVTSVS